MKQPAYEAESRDRDAVPPLEQELAGLPELNGFASEAERGAALRAVDQRIENPYTLSYWIWIAAMVCVAVAAARLIGWSLKAGGAPVPFPAALSVVGGVAVYFLLCRLVIRWAARPELQRELAERGSPLENGSDAGRDAVSPRDNHATRGVGKDRA